LGNKRFYDYVNGRYGLQGRLEKEAEELMDAIRAPKNLDKYDVKEWLKPVVNYWNNKYAGQYKFKVFIFNTTGYISPQNEYPEEENYEYNTPIILHYDKEKGNFHGIIDASGIFGKPYCLSCKTTYAKRSTHPDSCTSRCKKCSLMGPIYPCKTTPDYFQHCNDCNKNFLNQNCYKQHLISNFCANSKYCDKCDTTWLARKYTSGHKCKQQKNLSEKGLHSHHG
jgi:hypothetical protein